MALSRRTKLSSIEIDSEGRVWIKVMKEIVDGDDTPHREPLRTSIEPGADLNKELAELNSFLAKSGWPELTKADGEKLKSHLSLAHSKDVVDEWKKKMDALAEVVKKREAELERQRKLRGSGGTAPANATPANSEPILEDKDT